MVDEPRGHEVQDAVALALLTERIGELKEPLASHIVASNAHATEHKELTASREAGAHAARAAETEIKAALGIVRTDLAVMADGQSDFRDGQESMRKGLNSLRVDHGEMRQQLAVIKMQLEMAGSPVRTGERLTAQESAINAMRWIIGGLAAALLAIYASTSSWWSSIIQVIGGTKPPPTPGP